MKCHTAEDEYLHDGRMVSSAASWSTGRGFNPTTLREQTALYTCQVSGSTWIEKAMFGLAEAKTGSKGFCGTAALRHCGIAALWHCILSRVTPKYQNLTTYPSTNLLRRVESSVILEYVSNDNFKNFGGAVLSYSDCYLFQDYWFSPF